MNTKATMLSAANSMEQAVKVMEGCGSPNEKRSGLLKVALIRRTVPGQETLVHSMK